MQDRQNKIFVINMKHFPFDYKQLTNLHFEERKL